MWKPATLVTKKTATIHDTAKTPNGSKQTSNNTPECYKPIQLGTPLRPKQKVRVCESPADGVSSERLNKDNIEHNKEEDSSIVVAVRVRPLGQKEMEDYKVTNIIQVKENSVSVDCSASESRTGTLSFSFDHCLWSGDKQHPQYAAQQKVYTVIGQPILDKAFEGYNACLFAYGQTGSGKSYSILGHQNDCGIIPRFSQDLFERIQRLNGNDERVCVEISYFEIYNEKIHDLLASSAEQSKKAPMRVREHPVLGPYIVDLSTFVVTCHDDLAGWLSLGNKHRATAATVMNEKSSRSHSVFTFVITRVQTIIVDGEPHEHSRRSKVNIVDLAGSERANISDVQGADRLKEGASINMSLLSLGKVILQLSEMSQSNGSHKKVFVPYRESVLTWLLKESLGGNSRTTMLATVHPCSAYLEETLNTLRYACQARTIVNVVRVNEDPKARLIRELRAEIEKLRTRQNPALLSLSDVTHKEIQELKDKLNEKEQLLRQTTQSLHEKLQQAMKTKALETENLEKSGVALTVSNELPNLVNLNEDPQLSEALVYILYKGSVSIGRQKTDSRQDIQLKGSLIADDHCTITNLNNEITLVPNTKTHTYVNGHLVTLSTRLRHGDRIVLGGEHYFRLNNPAEVTKEMRKSANQKDFAFAREELLEIQETKLKEELEKTRQRIRQEMMEEIADIRKEAKLELGMQRQDYEERLKKLSEALEQQQTETTLLDPEDWKNSTGYTSTLAVELDEANVRKLSPVKSDVLNYMEEILMLADHSVVCGKDKTIVREKSRPLYELFLKIGEANSLCSDIGMQFSFQQSERLRDKGYEVTVRVRDVVKNATLEWTMETFDNKLAILRQMADGDTALQLFEEADVWEKEDHRHRVSFSPTIWQRIQLHQSSSSLDTSVSSDSPVNETPSRRLGKFTRATPAAGDDLGVDPLAIAREHCLATVHCFSEFYSSGKFSLDALSILLKLSEMMAIRSELLEVSKGNGGKGASLVDLSLRLSLLLSAVLAKASRFLPTQFLPQSKLFHELCVKFGQTCDKLGRSVASIIQDFTSGRRSTVGKTVEDVGASVLEIGSLLGQISATLGLALGTGNIVEAPEVDKDVALCYLGGNEITVRRILTVAVEKLEEAELRITVLTEDSSASMSRENDEPLLRCSHSLVVYIRNFVTTFRKKQEEEEEEAAENGLETIRRFVQSSNRHQHVTVNTSVLVEATIELCDDTEIYLRGGHVDLRQTLLSVADIRGSVETLYSLFQLHGLPSDDLHQTVKQMTVTSQRLKGILRQVLKLQEAHSTSSRSRPSPVKGGSRISSSPIHSLFSLSLPHQQHSPPVRRAGDDTSAWECSLPSSHSFVSVDIEPSSKSRRDFVS